jgi:hypothetical protein
MILRAIVRTGTCYRRFPFHRQGPGLSSLSPSLLLRFTRLGLVKKRSHTAQSDGGGVPLTIALRRPGLNTTLVRSRLAAGLRGVCGKKLSFNPPLCFLFSPFVLSFFP